MRRISALLLALASVPTFGQELRGPYIGLGIDQIDYSDTVHRIDFEDTATSKKIVAGFRFKETLAFEAIYGESDEFAANQWGTLIPFTSPIGPIGGETTARFTGTFDSLEIRALAHQGHWVLGLGYFSADTEIAVEGSSELGPFAGVRENSDSGYSLIVGGQWDFSDWGIRAEYSYFDLEGEADAYSLGVGFQYRF